MYITARPSPTVNTPPHCSVGQIFDIVSLSSPRFTTFVFSHLLLLPAFRCTNLWLESHGWYIGAI